jgi:plastocyanin
MKEDRMSRRTLVRLRGIALIVAACSSGGSPASGGPSAAGSACSEATGSGAVSVGVKDFAFEPAVITAKVGDVIAFTNDGFEPHNATLVAGGCGTKTLETGEVDGLRFTVAGTYPFHCTVHTQMTGTITVGG